MDTNHEIEMGSERQFGLVFAGFFALIALWPIQSGEPVRLWPLGLTLLFGIVALAWPTLLRPLNRVWFLIGIVLGKVVTPVIMGLVFVVAVIPTGVILRLRGHDPLRMRPDPAARSYWIERSEPTGTMKNQY